MDFNFGGDALFSSGGSLGEQTETNLLSGSAVFSHLMFESVVVDPNDIAMHHVHYPAPETGKRPTPETVEKKRAQKKKKKIDENLVADDYETAQRKIAWALVVRSVVTRSKEMHKLWSNEKDFAKKCAQNCQKIVKQKVLAHNKLQKDAAAILRGKKMARELLMNMGKFDRGGPVPYHPPAPGTTVESGSKREKGETNEKSKREEQTRERQRRLRRIYFLFRQSEFVSDFLKKKMGYVANFFEESEAEGGGGVSALDGELPLEIKIQIEAEAKDAAQKLLLRRARSAANFDTDLSKSQEISLANPPSMPQTLASTLPAIFLGNLQPYQLKGFNWLVSLYEQGVNGILADEMGLGKTIQTISFLAYLAAKRRAEMMSGPAGPFLVVAPMSKTHNWIQEFAKFCPTLKILPYFGATKSERKVLRKLFGSTEGDGGVRFDVLVTNYQIVVTDEKYIQRVKWHCMILDEAQAMKSSATTQWKTLLGFKCRSRLLLTGTPIRNTLGELWSLLHFIVPDLFDTFDEFDSWVSKDVEAFAENRSHLDQECLRRLHAILKPFLLRRVKTEVELELAAKIEFEILCPPSRRQHEHFKILRNEISLADLKTRNWDASGKSGEKKSSLLLNLVMQLRKVCNHPEIFERTDNFSAYQFQIPTAIPTVASGPLPLHVNPQNPISLLLPVLFLSLSDPNNGPPPTRAAALFNIYSSRHILSNEFSPAGTSELNFLHTVSRFVGFSPAEISFIASPPSLLHLLIALHALTHKAKFSSLGLLGRGEEREGREGRGRGRGGVHVGAVESLWAEMFCVSLRTQFDEECLPPDFIVATPRTSQISPTFKSLYFPKVLAPPIKMICSQRRFTCQHFPLEKYFDSTLLPASLQILAEFPRRIVLDTMPASTIRFSSVFRLVVDSGKLLALDSLLSKLYKNGDRVLIFSQMTKMLDILEDYCGHKKYRCVRMDGSNSVRDRRDPVEKFQSDENVFIFLLSTCAGGLGFDLTAANVVVFFDSDWNSTIDSHGLDQCHRPGQLKQVTVYRLVTEGTIEEKIHVRAKQTPTAQQVMMDGEDGGISAASDTDLMQLLLEEEEEESRLRKSEI